MKLNILTGISVLIIGSVPAVVKAETIKCFRNGNVIFCPNQGSYNVRNYSGLYLSQNYNSNSKEAVQPDNSSGTSTNSNSKEAVQPDNSNGTSTNSNSNSRSSPYNSSCTPSCYVCGAHSADGTPINFDGTPRCQ